MIASQIRMDFFRIPLRCNAHNSRDQTSPLESRAKTSLSLSIGCPRTYIYAHTLGNFNTLYAHTYEKKSHGGASTTAVVHLRADVYLFYEYCENWLLLDVYYITSMVECCYILCWRWWSHYTRCTILCCTSVRAKERESRGKRATPLECNVVTFSTS